MKAAIYSRFSSDSQDVELSIFGQIRALKDFAAKHGYEITREYVDEAESGRNTNRPAFREMISVAKAHNPPFEAILVWKLTVLPGIGLTPLLLRSSCGTTALKSSQLMSLWKTALPGDFWKESSRRSTSSTVRTWGRTYGGGCGKMPLAVSITVETPLRDQEVSH